MNILISLGHPAHFHLFKNIIQSLSFKAHYIHVLIKKKDILEQLLKTSNIDYVNILPEGRKDHKVGIIWGLIKRDYRLLKYCLKKNRPDLMIGTSIEISHIGKLLNISNININEDDYDIVPGYSKLAYPHASIILSPVHCRSGKWENKTIHYQGYHELTYLHPDRFTANINIKKQYVDPDTNYFLIRFAKLSAHHDTGIQGIGKELTLQIINLLKPYGHIYITSERKLEPEFELYRIRINPLDIHHVMAFASLFIGDSQTMAAEAGVLGTPFIRYNDFVGRISYLDELENKYNLGFGFRINESEKMLSKIKELLNTPNLKAIFQERRKKMLEDKIDVTAFITWFIQNYPESALIMKRNPDYQYNFK